LAYQKRVGTLICPADVFWLLITEKLARLSGGMGGGISLEAAAQLKSRI
jgi:hypothetical protein